MVHGAEGIIMSVHIPVPKNGRVPMECRDCKNAMVYWGHGMWECENTSCKAIYDEVTNNWAKHL